MYLAIWPLQNLPLDLLQQIIETAVLYFKDYSGVIIKNGYTTGETVELEWTTISSTLRIFTDPASTPVQGLVLILMLS